MASTIETQAKRRQGREGMRLISFDDGAGDRLGVEHEGGRIWSSRALGAGLPASMSELLEIGPTALDALRFAARSAESSGLPGDVRPAQRLAPVPRPGKVIAVGLNYHDHAAEYGMPVPDRPMLFAKFPTSVVGDGATVEWDPALTNAVDLEVELGVVIGTTTRRVAVEEALEHVLGYTCVNDVSARDLQEADGQFVRSKSLDTFCPMGPAVVTRDELGDARGLAVRSYLNDEIMQDSSTDQLIFGVADVVSFCSQAFTLEPGDVIATGTPAGVGWFRDPKVSMHDGDVMAIEIEGIGRLQNPCRELRAI
jgi:2-keto-4-pentenoate hydratase/2-oxohepta-3-ene-1,7-dioic acid hydratase in catechol pathway